MVKVLTCGLFRFMEETRDKAIFCFGAGKRFFDFVQNEKTIEIEGVIDNFCNKDYIDCDVKKYKVYKLDEFIAHKGSAAVIVITSASYQEIIMQLDAISELDGMICYLDSCIRDESVYINDSLHRTGQNIAIDAFLRNRAEHILVGELESINDAKYQIWECISESCTAGSKAPSDIKLIAEKCGFKAINIHQVYGKQEGSSENWSEIRNKQEWDACYNKISENAVLLLQHPFWQPQQTREACIRKLKENKGVRVISLVHDVEELRQVYISEYMNHEFQFMLEMADVIIVHNERMKEFFLAKGVEDRRLVVLEIFDYLCKRTGLVKFEKSISIAGNLDVMKSPYLRNIQGIGLPLVHLYGPNYQQADVNHFAIKYHGAFSSEEIVGEFEGGFGLVWDGESVETCTGGTGDYLRYNNPHKLSLYLAAGLPVFIWKDAAESRFVTENQLGFAVSSLYEVKDILDQITENEYIELVSNVKKISEKIRTGYYTKMILNQAEECILDSIESKGNMKDESR